VVWIWRRGHSPDRPWTTAATKDWEITHVRAGVLVSVFVSNQTPTNSYYTPAWDIPESTLVAVATSAVVRP
jgi:hypothetical protein